MDSLIYDRTSSDVESSLTNSKGSYNYTDLNRVEEWCEYLQSILANYGYSEELEIKTDWAMTDYITRTQMDRIRANIDSLKDFCEALSTETIEYDNTMNYKQANALEQILYDISQYIESEKDTVELSYNIGAVLITKEYVNITAVS